jgi:XTP/dITP diphosphohydrolase
LIFDGREYQFEGEINGTIASNPLGSNGFGYDPIFIPEGYETTFAQMAAIDKNQISHRAKALEKLKAFFGASSN